MNPFVILLLLFCAVLITIGAAKFVCWRLDRRGARIDADYRAARMVAQARAEVRRG